MARLAEKVALVTGASQGLGRAIALLLAREGAQVVVAARSAEKLRSVVETIVAQGGRALAVPTDVADEQQVQQLFAQIEQQIGQLDILVNNAASLAGGPLESLDSEVWRESVAVNLTAPFLCTRAAFPLMKRQGGGRIVNVASISAQRVRPESAPYAATKHGLWGLTQVTALEGRDHHIAACCIYPGNIRTENRSVADSDFNREPMMTMDEVAEAVLFMAAQPPHVNVLELTILPTRQAFLGRG